MMVATVGVMRIRVVMMDNVAYVEYDEDSGNGNYDTDGGDGDDDDVYCTSGDNATWYSCDDYRDYGENTYDDGECYDDGCAYDDGDGDARDSGGYDVATEADDGEYGYRDDGDMLVLMSMMVIVM